MTGDLVLPQLAGAQPDMYNFNLFREETVLKNPNAKATGYFYLFAGDTVMAPAVLDLWYSYSPTTRSDLSMMTVSVNGIPVSSQQLFGQDKSEGNWQIPLPVQYMKPGTNAISIDVIHRTIDGPCRDIDDPANWFIIRPQTRVNFQLQHGPYTLASLPQPFINPYLAAKTNTVIYLPDTVDKASMAGVFNLASSWGAASPAKLPQRLEVRYGKSGQVPANEVELKTGSAMQGLSLTTLPTNFQHLDIQAEDSKALYELMNSLSRPQFTKTLSGTQQTFATGVPDEPQKQGIFEKKKKDGTYTLADLGYTDDLTAAGAFHQEADIDVPRPSGIGISDASYIELHFRHSPILDPKKSAVTIYVNDIPVRAQALTPENAEHGLLKAPIPATELNKPLWHIRFGFYHDLGIIDCSKRYDEVAWSVVEKDTAVHLEPGDIMHEPSWEYFSSDCGIDDAGNVTLTMLLPDRPSAQELTAALKLAYYLGQQQNKRKVRWQVETTSTFDASEVKGAVVAIGKNDDATEWQGLKGILPVVPNGNGYERAAWVDAAEGTLSTFDICEIGRTKANKPVYAFQYATPERLNALVDRVIDKGNMLSGQLSLVDEQGKVVTFQQPEKANASSILAWFRQLTSGSSQNVAAAYAAIVGLAAVATILLLLWRKRHQH